MSENQTPAAKHNDELLEKIHAIQEEIFEREEQIATLLDSAEHPSRLAEAVEEGETRRRLRHLERLLADWDTLVARSRAVTEDDLDLVAAMVRLIGNLLLIQPEGIDASWIAKLEQYLEEQRARVS